MTDGEPGGNGSGLVSGVLGRRTAASGRARRTGLGFGGDYNPEQWPREVWKEDVDLMRESGVTFVTLGVFSWARLEPREGEFDFGWLDEVMGLMGDAGIAVDLATATASAPAWLSRAHPEMLPVDECGCRLSYGSRQSWCPSSPVYREHSLRLVRAMAERYGDHPALEMWHVSNELGCHNAHCYCDVSAAAFRRWLQEKYGDLEALNHAWGTDFWSQRYGDWEEVLPPRRTTAQPNPTQQLDFRRFSSDELLGQHLAEREVLREVTPGVPVTTNFMVTSHIDALDYWRWAPEQDVVSQDHYLDARLADPELELSLCADWTRGLAGGRPWVLMEHSTSAVNWQPRNHPKAPGQMLRNSLQHVARGADAVGFFQWRASKAGAEKYHSAMLPHAGTDSRVWREVVELGSVLQRLGEIAGTEVVGSVAMLLDWDSRWAVQRDSLPTSDLSYLDRPVALYGALVDAGVTVDICHPTADLSAYPVVFAPMLHVLPADVGERLASYVRGGGRLLTTYFSGVVDEHDHIRLGGYPGPLREALGLRVEEFCPLTPGASVALEGSLGAGTADEWVEDVVLAGAEALLSCTDGPMPGRAVVTRHRFGDGEGWYVAARTDDETTAAVVRAVLASAGVEAETLRGVEVVRRAGPDRSYLLAINHSADSVSLPANGVNLLTGQEIGGTLVVDAGGVACVREERG